jgi:hypothetical protein
MGVCGCEGFQTAAVGQEKVQQNHIYFPLGQPVQTCQKRIHPLQAELDFFRFLQHLPDRLRVGGALGDQQDLIRCICHLLKDRSAVRKSACRVIRAALEAPTATNRCPSTPLL